MSFRRGEGRVQDQKEDEMGVHPDANGKVNRHIPDVEGGDAVIYYEEERSQA